MAQPKYVTLDEVARWVTLNHWRKLDHLAQPRPSGSGFQPIRLDRDGYINEGFLDLASVLVLLFPYMHLLATKSTPADLDEFIILDSAASYAGKRMLYSSLRDAVKTYYDTVSTVMTNKILTTPTIASFVNATHNHQNAAGGGQLDHTLALTNIGSNTHAQIDTALAMAVINDATAAAHIAATAAHGATGAVVGTTTAQTLTNKTLDSTNISTLTGKTTPVDADSVVLVDSAASNFFKRVTGTNLKAYLKTYFDTLYDLTATAITALATKTIPVDADAVVITDSAAAGVPKRTTWANIKATLKTYFDGLYLAFATASGVTTTTINGTLLVSINSGSVTTAQTWTVDITLTANNRVNAIADVFFGMSSTTAATQRVLYRATIGFSRATVGNTAVIDFTNEHANLTTLTTLTGPTAIADGIRFTFQPTSNTSNRTGGTVILNAGPSSPLVTSVVA